MDYRPRSQSVLQSRASRLLAKVKGRIRLHTRSSSSSKDGSISPSVANNPYHAHSRSMDVSFKPYMSHPMLVGNLLVEPFVPGDNGSEPSSSPNRSEFRAPSLHRTVTPVAPASSTTTAAEEQELIPNSASQAPRRLSIGAAAADKKLSGLPLSNNSERVAVAANVDGLPNGASAWDAGATLGYYSNTNNKISSTDPTSASSAPAAPPKQHRSTSSQAGKYLPGAPSHSLPFLPASSTSPSPDASFSSPIPPHDHDSPRSPTPTTTKSGAQQQSNNKSRPPKPTINTQVVSNTTQSHTKTAKARSFSPARIFARKASRSKLGVNVNGDAVDDDDNDDRPPTPHPARLFSRKASKSKLRVDTGGGNDDDADQPPTPHPRMGHVRPPMPTSLPPVPPVPPPQLPPLPSTEGLSLSDVMYPPTMRVTSIVAEKSESNNGVVNHGLLGQSSSSSLSPSPVHAAPFINVISPSPVLSPRAVSGPSTSGALTHEPYSEPRSTSATSTPISTIVTATPKNIKPTPITTTTTDTTNTTNTTTTDITTTLPRRAQPPPRLTTRLSLSLPVRRLTLPTMENGSPSASARLSPSVILHPPALPLPLPMLPAVSATTTPTADADNGTSAGGRGESGSRRAANVNARKRLSLMPSLPRRGEGWYEEEQELDDDDAEEEYTGDRSTSTLSGSQSLPLSLDDDDNDSNLGADTSTSFSSLAPPRPSFGSDTSRNTTYTYSSGASYASASTLTLDHLAVDTERTHSRTSSYVFHDDDEWGSRMNGTGVSPSSSSVLPLPLPGADTPKIDVGSIEIESESRVEGDDGGRPSSFFVDGKAGRRVSKPKGARERGSIAAEKGKGKAKLVPQPRLQPQHYRHDQRDEGVTKNPTEENNAYDSDNDDDLTGKTPTSRAPYGDYFSSGPRYLRGAGTAAVPAVSAAAAGLPTRKESLKLRTANVESSLGGGGIRTPRPGDDSRAMFSSSHGYVGRRVSVAPGGVGGAGKVVVAAPPLQASFSWNGTSSGAHNVATNGNNVTMEPRMDITAVTATSLSATTRRPGMYKHASKSLIDLRTLEKRESTRMTLRAEEAAAEKEERMRRRKSRRVFSALGGVSVSGEYASLLAGVVTDEKRMDDEEERGKKERSEATDTGVTGATATASGTPTTMAAATPTPTTTTLLDVPNGANDAAPSKRWSKAPAYENVLLDDIGISPALRRRRSLPTFGAATADPPPYPEFTFPSSSSSQFRHMRIQPRDDEGQERLPSYSNDIYLCAELPRKMEFTSAGVQAKDRKWRRVVCVIEGTALKVYKSPKRIGKAALGDWWERKVGVGDVALPSGSSMGASSSAAVAAAAGGAGAIQRSSLSGRGDDDGGSGMTRKLSVETGRGDGDQIEIEVQEPATPITPITPARTQPHLSGEHPYIPGQPPPVRTPLIPVSSSSSSMSPPPSSSQSSFTSTTSPPASRSVLNLAVNMFKSHNRTGSDTSSLQQQHDRSPRPSLNLPRGSGGFSDSGDYNNSHSSVNLAGRVPSPAFSSASRPGTSTSFYQPQPQPQQQQQLQHADGQAVGPAPTQISTVPEPGLADLIRRYTMQNAESGLGNDYLKRKNVIRVRAEGEQFLLQAKDVSDVIAWIEALQASANISLDLDERLMPKGPLFPRRRRRRRPVAASTDQAPSNTATATAG